MTLRSRSLISVGIVIMISGAMSAHQGRQGAPPSPSPVPARDTPMVAMTGTATISGTVVADDESATPLRRVTLSLSRPGVAGTWLTATDDRGRFLFKELPPGNFILSASKGGYVSASYGATKVGLPGSPIPIVDGEQFAAHPIKLMHGAVITGVVTNAKGKPVPGASVQAAQFQVVNGERKRRNVGSGTGIATTDAEGAYRIFGLAPGDYLVSSDSRLDFFAVSGELRGMTPAAVKWAQSQIDNPAAPPDPDLAAAAAKSGPAIASAPSFYPGTSDPQNAAVVTLSRAEERSGIDFPVVYVSTARISGVVAGIDGKPAASAFVVRAAKQTNQFTSSFDLASTARTGPDGKFAFAGVPPGEYTVMARAAPGGGSAPGRGNPAPGPVMPTGPLSLWGMTDVSVNGDDVSAVTVSLQPGMTVSGTIAFDGSVLQPPSDLTRIQTRLVAPPNTTTVTVNAQPTTAKADGTFTLDDVIPGAYRMSATAPTVPGAANNWVIASATLDGKNVLDFPFDVQPGRDVSGVAVTFTDRQTEFTGTLVDGAGKPTPQFYVLAFPTDKAYWTTGSRWIKPARAGLDGTFKITGLPPGEYYVCALTEIDNAQLTDPGYLEAFVSASTKITLADGVKRVLDLRAGG